MSDEYRIWRDFENDRDMIHLPDVSFIDTQVWSVDLGMRRDQLADLYRHIGLWLEATGEIYVER